MITDTPCHSLLNYISLTLYPESKLKTFGKHSLLGHYSILRTKTMICLDDMKDNNLIVPLSFFREVYVIKILDHRIYFSKAGYWKSIKVNVLHYGKKRTREHNVEDTKDLNDMAGEWGWPSMLSMFKSSMLYFYVYFTRELF